MSDLHMAGGLRFADAGANLATTAAGVDIEGHVALNSNRYSVPEWIGRRVEVR
jgi:hypothetical protein